MTSSCCGKAGVEQRLQPAVVLHPVGERVADDRDVILRSSSSFAAVCPPLRTVAATTSPTANTTPQRFLIMCSTPQCQKCQDCQKCQNLGGRLLNPATSGAPVAFARIAPDFWQSWQFSHSWQSRITGFRRNRRVPAGHIRRLDVLDVAVERIRRRLERADEADVVDGRIALEAGRPQQRVDAHPPESVVQSLPTRRGSS